MLLKKLLIWSQVSAGVLLPGETYAFVVRTSFESTPEHAASIEVAVQVSYDEILVEGALGAARTQAATEPLVLAASPEDPGRTVDRFGNPTPWSFKWECFGFCEETRLPSGEMLPCTDVPPLQAGEACFRDARAEAALLEDSAQVVIPAGALRAGVTYRFRCDISKEPRGPGRAKAAFVDVHVPSYPALSVNAGVLGGANAGDAVRGGQNAEVRCECGSLAVLGLPKPAARYSWALRTTGPTEPSKPLEQLVLETYGEVRVNNRDLVLDGLKLVHGQTYNLRCAVEVDVQTGAGPVTLIGSASLKP